MDFEKLNDLTNEEIKFLFRFEQLNDLPDTGLVGEIKQYFLSGREDFTVAEKVNYVEKLTLSIVYKRWIKLIDDKENEIQARVDFKIREILTAVKNKSKFNYNIAFQQMSQKHSHYSEAFSEFEELVMKEIYLPLPYDEIYKFKVRNVRDKSIDKLITLFNLREQRDSHNKITQIVKIIEETQNI